MHNLQPSHINQGPNHGIVFSWLAGVAGIGHFQIGRFQMSAEIGNNSNLLVCKDLPLLLHLQSHNFVNLSKILFYDIL